jgi:hypothetical protein
MAARMTSILLIQTKLADGRARMEMGVVQHGLGPMFLCFGTSITKN